MATENTQPAASVERTVSLQRSLYDPGYVNAMSHFYRGEMGRIMVWRQRLDITTNWAITSSTAIITIAFSNSAVPHIIFFFNLAIVWAMLWIEARRYRFYDAFRARVRMLEANYVFIFILILVAWVTKIFLHADHSMDSVPAFYRALRVGHIPSWLVAGIFVGTFISIISITIYVGKKFSGEISEFGTHRSLWRI